MKNTLRRSAAALLLGCFLLGGSTEYVSAAGFQPVTETVAQPNVNVAEKTTADIPVQEAANAETAAQEAQTVAEASAKAAPGPLQRELMKETFDNGNEWNVNSKITSFANGKVLFKGAGPDHHMVSKNKIYAQDMLIHVDLDTLPGNTNANTKIGFRGGSSFQDERLQVRFNYPGNTVLLEKAAGNSTKTTYATASLADLDIKTPGKSLKVDIQVKGETATVWVNGAQILTATDASIAAMPQGPILIAGQYPNQEFTLDNLLVTTDEAQSGTKIPVTLKVMTDGVESNAGGTLTADRESGYSGDVVNLSVSAKHGYVFDKFTTNTDNLIVIENNRFQLNEKFPKVEVTAHFVTRKPGRDELHFEDFGGSVTGLPAGCTIENEKLLVAVPAGQQNAAYTFDSKIFEKLAADDGYRITLDLNRLPGNDGTLQVAFRGGDDFSERYALVINTQGLAMLRQFHKGQNNELKKVTFQLEKNVDYRAVIEVMGNRVTVSINGKNLMDYTDAAQWQGMAPKVQLINMTPGTKVAFDNVLVERIRQRKEITVTTLLGGAEDKAYTAGTVTLDQTQASAGDTVTLKVMAKAGYSLKTVTFEGVGGALAEVPTVNQQGQFVMPEGDYKSLTVKAQFETAEAKREARTFYIDSENGDDAADGLSEKTAWKTVSQLANRPAFQPGDQILLKRGSVFQAQQLAFSGMGTKEKPIVVGAYGKGTNYPRLEGQGKIENVVSLNNQQYITVKDLEITNLHPDFDHRFELRSSNNRKVLLRAVNVSIQDFGVASGIHIENCYIHDINGSISAKWNGGVFFDVQATIEGGQLKGVPSKYDDISITGCTFERVDRSAIKLVSSRWCNQWEKNDPGVPRNWYPSTNVVVKDNYMEYIGGDGITVRDTDGALIEGNLAKDCRFQDTGYNVAIWPFEAANTVIQYNESYNTHGNEDGQGFDCDHASSNSVMQYNYSHNNEGGFMLIMGGYNHIGATVRYNISQNDRDKAFEFAQGLPLGTMIYNNTLYSDSKLPRGLFLLSNTGKGTGIYDGFVFNNVFCYPQGQHHFHTEVQALKDHMKFFNNAYVGGIQAPEQDSKPLVLASIGEAGFVNPGKAPEVNPTHKPLPHDHEGLKGYQLTENSPLKDKGVTLQEAMTHFGVSPNGPVDGRSMSPRELFEQAKKEQRSSIDCVVGENFPVIAGVSYDLDFFGNKLTDTPDMGAAEFTKEKPVEPKPDPDPDPEPPVPSNPVDPEPSVPTNPVDPKPTNPAEPSDPAEPSAPAETTAPTETPKPAKPQTPATGDGQNIFLLVFLCGASFLLLLDMKRRKAN